MNEEFIKKWLEKEYEKSEDFTRFFFLYMSFNYLYEGFRQEKRLKRCPELSVIKKFIGYCFETHRLTESSIYLQHNSPFLIRPIRDARPLSESNEEARQRTFLKLKQNNGSKECIESIFITLYQVRCNLFHGMKTPDKDRDIKLIREGNEILRQFFNKYYAK